MTKLTIENVTALVEKYGALQHPREALNLLQFLTEHPPSVVVEVGVWRGGNLALIGAFFPDARLIGVDMLSPDDPEEAFSHYARTASGCTPALRDTVKTFGIEMVTGSSGDTAVLDAVLDKLDGKTADYLFIDAAHDSDSVRRDYAAWSPHAHHVGFHDVHNEAVFEVWLEVIGNPCPNLKSFSIWKEIDGHGIGVLS